MKVTELNRDQLDELRMQYNYDVNDSTAYVDETDISNHVLFDYYAGIEFVPEDFTASGIDEANAESDYFRNFAINEFASCMDENEVLDICNMMGW